MPNAAQLSIPACDSPRFSTASFDPGEHVYTADGVVVPSVTQVLTSVGKRPDLSRVDPEVLEAKRALGTLVHEACMVIAAGDDLDWEALGLGEPYARAFKKFLVDTRMKVEHMEWHTVCEVDGIRYGMKLDIAGLLHGRPAVGEIKTTASVEKWWRLQTAAYKLGLELSFPRPLVPPFEYERFVVHLKKTASYALISHDNPDDVDAWRSALKLAVW